MLRVTQGLEELGLESTKSDLELTFPKQCLVSQYICTAFL